MRSGAGGILTAACVLAMIAAMRTNAETVHIEDETANNLKGGSNPDVVFTLPDDYPWMWRLWAVTASGWEHVPDTQDPDSSTWEPTGFTGSSGYWTSIEIEDSDTPERNFQRPFYGELRPEGAGGEPQLYDFTINASAGDYFVKPPRPVVCVSNTVILTAYDSSSNTVVSTWSIAPTNGVDSLYLFDGTNTSTSVDFSSSEPNEYKVTGTSTNNTEHTDSAVVTIIKVDLEFQNSKMSSGKIIDEYLPPTDVKIGVVKGDAIKFKAKLTPNIKLSDSDYVWSGAQFGTGPTIDITFNNAVNYAEGLSVLSCPQKVASITSKSVPLPNQATWAILYPLSALNANALATEAIDWAADNWSSLGGSSGVHNCRADAARHAYWNILMSVEMDTGTAEGAATAHERTNLEGGSAHNEIVMDLENNAAGRGLSAGLSTNRPPCQAAVTNALNAGQLTILDDLPNVNEVGLLKPSDQ